ncbi:hypothetical protein AAEP93_002122 [Penicillium crustosum]
MHFDVYHVVPPPSSSIGSSINIVIIINSSGAPLSTTRLLASSPPQTSTKGITNIRLPLYKVASTFPSASSIPLYLMQSFTMQTQFIIHEALPPNQSTLKPFTNQTLLKLQKSASRILPTLSSYAVYTPASTSTTTTSKPTSANSLLSSPIVRYKSLSNN